MIFKIGKLIRFFLVILTICCISFLYACERKDKIKFIVTPPESTYGSSSNDQNVGDDNRGDDTSDDDGDVSQNDDGDDISDDEGDVGADSDNADASYDETSGSASDSNTVYNISSITINCKTSNSSAANLDMMDKAITTGISISPDIPGTWKWEDENNLVFNPTKDWAPDTEYTVTMMPAIFNKKLPNRKRSVTFTSPAFDAQVASHNVTRAPGEEKTPRFTAEIDFTHKIDNASFEKSLKLTLDGNNVKYDVTYNDAMRKAFIRSAPVAIMDHPRKFLLVASKFTSMGSKSQVANDIRVSDTVPDYSALFYLKDISAEIVKDSKDTPQQVVFLEFSDTVARDDISSNLNIYLLPQYKPNLDDDNENDSDYSYDWSNDTKGAIAYYQEGEKLNFKYGPSDGLPETIHPFIIDVRDDVQRYILVKFDAKIKSKSGFPLKKSFAIVKSVPRYPKELNMIQDGAILPLSGSKLLTFAARGIDNMQVTVGRLTSEQQLQNVIVSTYSGGLKNLDFKGDGMDENNFATFTTQKVLFANSSPKEVSYASIDMGKYMKNGEAGLFFIKASSDYGPYVSRIILVTDMGLIRKVNNDKSSSVFVMSFTDQNPVVGAKVDVIGKNGVPVYSGTTDDGGRFNYPDLSDLEREKTPVAIVVRNGSDISFLPLNISDRMVNYSRFDIGGINDADNDENGNGLSAFLFSDRGMYRPGETVHLGSIIKQQDWRSLAGVAVQASIENPNGKTVEKQSFSLSPSGMIDFDYKSDMVSPTGTYQVDLYLMENDRVKTHLGNTTFQLEEFEPDTMIVKTSILGANINGWQKPDNVSGYIKVDNMFGNPASGRRVKWTAQVTPVTFYSNAVEGYRFTDPNIDKTGAIRKVFTPNISDGKTNSNGEAKADLGLGSIGTGTYMLILSGESFEPGSGDSVYSADTAMISSLDYLVGYKTLGNLNFVRRNSSQEVDFIAVNNKMKKISLDNLKYNLVSINYVMSLIKGTDGAYRYQSVQKRLVKDSGKFTIDEAGTKFSLPTADAGRFVFEITSPDGTVVGRVPYFVTGATNLQSGVEKNAELTLQLNKSEYAPGENIDVNIISPYTGAGLITIERDKVYAYHWFKTTTTSSVQHISVPNNLEGNAYINVSFVRSPNSKEIFINPLSYGVAPFSIDKEKRTVHISLSAPDLTIPGDDMVIKYSADKDAKLVLFGVDEGILQVAGYHLPNPLGFFFQKRALNVDTYQTVDLVLPDYSIIKESFATGGGEAAIAKGLNPFARKTFKPTSFWSKTVNVEAGKEYEFKYNVPEYFNGTMKIMAVAASQSSVGSAETSVLARSPIVMLPNAPYAVTEGDTFQVTLGVTNNIEGAKESSDIKITANSSPQVSIVGEKVKTVKVPVGSERVIVFNVKAIDKVGAASITFTAENAGVKKPINSTATLSVRPSSIYKTKLDINKFTSASFDIKNIFRNMHDAYSKREVGVSDNPLGALVGMVGYLTDYPYGCSEQITSKVFPLIYLNAAEGIESQKVKDIFDSTINKLRSRQDGSDGFNMWDNYHLKNKFISVYITHFLLDASEMGYSVPGDMKDFAISFLNGISADEPKDLDDARTEAYAIYLLTRSGKVTSRQLANLEEYLDSKYEKVWKNDLTAAFIGASYIIMKETDKGQSLMKGVDPIEGKYVSYGDYDSSSIRNSLYLYLIGKHYSEHLSEVSIIAENILKDISAGYFNTLSSTYAIIALGSYSTISNQEIPQISSFVGKTENKLEAEGKNIAQAKFDKTTDKLHIKYSDGNKAGRFYYVLQSGFDKVAPKSVSNGIEVTKEYLDAAGKKISEIKQGDEITVKIRVRLNDDNIKFVNNLAITDLLTGGTEVIRNKDLSLGFNYDLREDRVIIYTNLPNDKVKEFSYKLKALSTGSFNIPPVFAEDMYKSSVNASSDTGVLKINGVE